MGRHAYTMGQLWGVMTDFVGGVMAMGRHDRVPFENIGCTVRQISRIPYEPRHTIHT